MKILTITIDFFREVIIAVKEIIREIKKTSRKKHEAGGTSEQYLQLTNEIDGLADYIVKNGESLGKTALELALKGGLIDQEGFVTPKAKDSGITQNMIQPFKYKPTIMN